VEEQDPDPHVNEKLDPDPHVNEKLDPDPHIKVMRIRHSSAYGTWQIPIQDIKLRVQTHRKQRNLLDLGQ
jgi:hypothetical protein